MRLYRTCLQMAAVLCVLVGVPPSTVTAADDAGGDVSATAPVQQPEDQVEAAVSPGTEQATDPSHMVAVAVVEELHEAILEVMKHAQQLGYDGREKRLDPALRVAFDLAFMAEKSAGRHWKDFSDEQKKRWIDTFDRHTVANYAGRFDGYSGQHFETLATQAAGFGTVLVRTKLIQPNDDDVEINYRLRSNSDVWKVIDIYLSGTVSELALRRAEYGSVLKRDGFEKLIDDLESKITELQHGGATG